MLRLQNSREFDPPLWPLQAASWAAAAKTRFWTPVPKAIISLLQLYITLTLLASGGCPGSLGGSGAAGRMRPVQPLRTSGGVDVDFMSCFARRGVSTVELS